MERIGNIMDLRDRSKLRSARSDDFIYEEELERELIAMGMTRRELRADLKNYLTLEHQPVNIDRCTIGSTMLVANRDLTKKYAGSVYVVDWLNQLDMDAFNRISAENVKKISSLMRHPGGLHEWLMIVEIPALKEMGIDLEKVKTCRTQTAQCRFALNENDTSLSGRHGGTGSGRMHIALREALQSACNEWKEDPSEDPMNVLKNHLLGFAQTFYPGGPDSVPQGLMMLIR